jgi:hypothetical protein
MHAPLNFLPALPGPYALEKLSAEDSNSCWKLPENQAGCFSGFIGCVV